MNDSEHDLQAIQEQMRVGEDRELDDHRESDEGINDDNPDFNQNEFMFKHRQHKKEDRRAMDMNDKFNPAGVPGARDTGHASRQMA